MSAVLRQREPRYENRKLLDVAHEAPCMLMLSPTCGANKSVPCHSDMLEHGRGACYKSHDCYAIPGCPACHALFTRENLGRPEYERVWQAAFTVYQRWLWVNGKVRVAA